MQTTVNQRLAAIRKGREYLQENEWIQEEYFDTTRGYVDHTRTDVIGAIACGNGWYEVGETSVRITDLFKEVLDELNEDIPRNYDDITIVNDMAFTKQDVLDQLDKTIRRLEAEPMQLEITFSEAV